MTRPYWRRRTRELAVVLVLAALVVVRIIQGVGQDQPPEAIESGDFSVARVIDGDTLRLISGARLRLQGVDAPEAAREDAPAEPWSRDATEFTEAFLEAAQWEIRVDFGPERKDQYGRFLGFVWHGDRLLNEELVREGLARATTQYHFSEAMKRRLRQAQSEAQIASRGIWSK
jgi:micrococcal nuclease